MAPFPHCYYSNRIEILFDSFKAQLFAHSHPLSRRLVIVPGPTMRTWLLHSLARDPAIGVAAGIEVGFIEPTLHKLCAVFAPAQYKHMLDNQEPSALELALALEREISHIVRAFDSLPPAERRIWQPMLDYLHGTEQAARTAAGGSVAQRVVKRTHALAVKLAALFLDYGRTGGAVTASWNHSRVESLGWQESLWVRMEKLYAPWNYPARQFAAFAVETAPMAEDLQVHVFALSYLSPLHHQMLAALGKHVPVNYYWLSPCQKFWSDLVSDKERHKLAAYWRQRGTTPNQQEELEAYLRDNNPLLANFGKLGREMALQIDNSEFLVSDAYAVSGDVRGKKAYEELLSDELQFDEAAAPLSLLGAVQADLTLLRNPAASPALDFEDYDHTIQVHEAPTPLREVQIAYDTVVGIIERHRRDQEPILPADIIVMAPDIGKYAAYIKSVFGAPDSALDCQIMDLKVPVQNAFVQSFLHLLRLPFGRWETTSLLKLFEYTAFHSRHQLTREDLHAFKNWFKSAGICWGKDSAHRNELLRRDHCFNDMVEDSWAGTWEHGLGRLLEGLAMLPSDGLESAFAPLDHIQSTQSDLLGTLLHLLRSLMDDLKPLGDRTRMTLDNWSLYLKCLLEIYFLKSNTSEDAEGHQILLQQFEAFKVAGKKLDGEEFEFYSVLRHLEQALHKQTAIHRENCLHAVRFCSLQPMRAIPAKVIVLMGMQEGEFPRNADPQSLNLLHGHPQADYYPSAVEFDRYLFLETLLSARRYLLLSYISYAPGDSGQTLPSPLVAELLSYLNNTYSVHGEEVERHCRFQHPLLPFDARYFSEGSRFSSHSKAYYAAACAYYAGNKQPPHAFVPVFAAPPAHVDTGHEDLCVPLQDLNAFAKNPIKTYINKTLGIYPDKEADRVTRKEEALHLSTLDAAIIGRQGLKAAAAQLLARAEREGTLPRGPFKAVGQKQVLDLVIEHTKNLHSYGVVPEEIFSIECSDRYRECTLTGKQWCVPPLHIETAKGTVKLVGTLEHVSRQGLIHFAKDGFDDALKIWPTLLVLCCLIKAYALPVAPGLVFAKSLAKKARRVDFADPERLLADYLNYYFQAHQCPSPLLPELVLPIMHLSEADFREVYQADPDDRFKPVYDDIFKWLKRNSLHADTTSATENWNATAQSLFVDLHTAWYAKPAQAGTQEADHDLI